MGPLINPLTWEQPKSEEARRQGIVVAGCLVLYLYPSLVTYVCSFNAYPRNNDLPREREKVLPVVKS